MFLFEKYVPVDTDFTQYHRIDLWVPATATRDGYAEYCFDNRKVGGTIAWSQYTNQEPPPKPPLTFGIIDKNHLVLILGTGVQQAYDDLCGRRQMAKT